MNIQKNYNELILKKVLFMLITILIGLTTIQAASLDLYEEKTFNVSSGETLEMEVMGGDIKLAAWDKNEVYIKVFANKNAQDKLEFTFEKTSSGVFIKSEKKSSFSWSWSGISTKFEIMVPRDFVLDLKTSGGDINVRDVKGMKKIKTSGGDIAILNTVGNLDAKTSGGDIEISKLNGKVDISTSGGDIDIMDASDDISASTSGGDIRIKNSNGKIEAKTSGGDVEVYHKAENRGMELYSSGGDIKIKFDKSISADLDLYTTGGKVSCGLSGLKIREMKSNSLDASVNGGGSKIKAKTTGGDKDID